MGQQNCKWPDLIWCGIWRWWKYVNDLHLNIDNFVIQTQIQTHLKATFNLEHIQEKPEHTVLCYPFNLAETRWAAIWVHINPSLITQGIIETFIISLLFAKIELNYQPWCGRKLCKMTENWFWEFSFVEKPVSIYN